MDEVIIEEEIYYTDGTGYSDDNYDVPSEDGVQNFELQQILAGANEKFH